MDQGEIEKYRYDFEIITGTAKQCKKDFGMVGIEVTFSGNPNTAYLELLHQLTPALKDLYLNNQAGFMALVYRIDLEESKLRTITASYTGEALYNQLTLAIIDKEFTKVLARKLFNRSNGLGL